MLITVSQTNHSKMSTCRVIKVDASELGENDGPFINFKGAKRLINILIESGECKDPGHAIKILQDISDQMDKKQNVVTCAACAQKVGLHKCSGCPKDSKTRYCSRECQLAAWPSHKTSCGGGKAKHSCK